MTLHPDDLPIPPTAAVADALVRLKRGVRAGPSELRRLVPGGPVAGPAQPVRHFGSVDVFLEALQTAQPGAFLIIDNGGREDEACIGDLTVAEFKLAGLSGVVVWGYHRDSAALREIGLPVWSLGAMCAGPATARAREDDAFDFAMAGEQRVVPTDMVVADDDGVLFVPQHLWPEASTLAGEIAATEHRQAGTILAGTSLRSQLDFDAYLQRRTDDPAYTFRRHLAERGGAIET